MIFQTKIARLEMMPIIGNARDDRDLFNLAREIATDETIIMVHRIRALKFMDRAMGEKSRVTEASVRFYSRMMEMMEEILPLCDEMKEVQL